MTAAGPLFVRARRALVQGELRQLDLLVTEGCVSAVAPSLQVPESARVVETDVLSPGFVDLHVHALDGAGTFGVPDVPGLSAALAKRGVTSFLATAAAAPVEELLALLAPVQTSGARCLGAHLEGPWLSAEYAGAQPREGIAAPELAELERLLAATPPRMITLAPELPGGLDLIARA
ncbi:MAG: hypothetical protein M3P04_05055, partial [Actinomycetota bacterium]|nr:hypothetical protein [Actinomycetota bacterium]